MEQKQVLRELLQDRVFRIFHEISQIPHGSANEEKISLFLVDWAKKRNLFVMQDEYNNVLMRKKASTGYEQAPGILLQAHMDMVCEKVPESSHDFTKDPISWVIEGDYVTTGGETTLGADDGIGMALAMAVLEEDTWKHPAIEVLFTVMEEEDLSGAIRFDTSHLQSCALINLDNVNDQEIVCGSCGGEAVEVELPADCSEVPGDWVLYRLEAKGLKGGHSGEDIHKGRGNANRILARVWLELNRQIKFKICSLNGGSFRLAIPREALCVIALPKELITNAAEIIHNLEEDLRIEYQSAGAQFSLCFTPCEDTYHKAYDIQKLISLILFSPDGIWEMNADMENLVNSSDNLGEMYLEEKGYRVVYEIRAAHNSSRNHIAHVIERLAHTLGGTCKVHSAYPSWSYRSQSPLREAAVKVFEAANGCSPKVFCVHAGLEVGCFFATKPEMDAISIGPNCYGLHSPEEKVSISSTRKVYGMLQSLLEKLL